MQCGSSNQIQPGDFQLSNAVFWATVTGPNCCKSSSRSELKNCQIFLRLLLDGVACAFKFVLLYLQVLGALSIVKTRPESRVWGDPKKKNSS